MAYASAQEFGKTIFLFFPSPQCKLDQTESMVRESDESITPEGQDTPEQREWQKKYADSILSTTKLRYKFDNYDHLRWLTAEAVFKISPEAAAGPIPPTLRPTLPTPLTLLYHTHFGQAT